MHYVIGSGPAGVACAMALTARGEEVTMLDAGLPLERELAALVAGLSRRTPREWDPDALARIKVLGEVKGIPRKLVYGSEYVYQYPEGYQSIRGKGVDFSPSFALGGLSNAWGAAMLPYLQEDIDDWPITVPDLTPHYRRVLDFVPLAGRVDSLSERFPLYTDKPCDHRSSGQAKSFLAALERHRDDLATEGVIFGRSRLAVTVTQGSVEGCVYCGMCMFGCPYDFIYSSRHTLTTLLAQPTFRYIGGVVVERLEERGDAVIVQARTVAGEHVSYEAERVFVGAGAMPTTKIVMDTLGLGETTLKDSQYFLLPMLQMTGSGARKEDLHTLAQVFIEIREPSISDRTVHLQLYTYNEIYDLELRRRFGRLYPLVPSGMLLDRMSLIQGFLHSDDSRQVTVRRRDGRLRLYKAENSHTRGIVSRVVRKIGRNSARLAAVPVLPMLQIAQPGKSFHFGGTFPMSRTPERGQTDVLGRPHGLERVHLIDSSVLPSIPATTITLSVMANAYRIGAEHED
ncbi:MAG TPA: GMC oxidoreductase [Dehalococcoidia bacterium]|jgi:choline dehydrogenase-like flavoprotein